jgi:predicted RNase H-like nuclease
MVLKQEKSINWGNNTMTDKVIIDGIDVCKCEFYCSTAKFHKCDCLGAKPRKDSTVENLNCEENPNCYFKQLARAKEEIEKLRNLQDDLVKENEKLKSQITSQDCEIYDLKSKIKALEELKKIKNDFFNQLTISHEAVMNKNKIIEKLEQKLEKTKNN